MRAGGKRAYRSLRSGDYLAKAKRRGVMGQVHQFLDHRIRIDDRRKAGAPLGDITYVTNNAGFDYQYIYMPIYKEQLVCGIWTTASSTTRLTLEMRSTRRERPLDHFGQERQSPPSCTRFATFWPASWRRAPRFMKIDNMGARMWRRPVYRDEKIRWLTRPRTA